MPDSHSSGRFHTSRQSCRECLSPRFRREPALSGNVKTRQYQNVRSVLSPITSLLLDAEARKSLHCRLRAITIKPARKSQLGWKSDPSAKRSESPPAGTQLGPPSRASLPPVVW